MSTIDVEAMRRAMIVIAFVGAAAADATPAQRSLLRDDALPPLRDPELSAAQAYEKTLRTTGRIMGKDWRPAGEWEDWLLSLLGDPA